MIINWLRGAYENARLNIDRDDNDRVTVLSAREPIQDYHTLRETVGVAPSMDWALIGIEGPDALDYLHRRLTRSIKRMPEGEGRHALQLEGDGRLAADMLVYRFENELMVLTGAPQAEDVYQLISKFILMDEVTTHRLWEAGGTIGLIGPRADELIERLAAGVTLPPPEERSPWRMLMPVDLFDVTCRVFRDGRWAVPYYHIAAPYDELPALVRDLDRACREIGGGAVGVEAIERLRIESDIARFGVDTDANTIPLEAGLAGAVDFDKGCFPGQEILARIRNLGHPARLLTRLELTGELPVERGAAIVIDGDQEAGRVTSSSAIPGSGVTVALGSLKWAHRETTEVYIETAAGPAPAKVAHVVDKDAYRDEVQRPVI